MKTGYRRGTRILCTVIAALFVIASLPSDIMAAEALQAEEQIVPEAEAYEEEAEDTDELAGDPAGEYEDESDDSDELAIIPEDAKISFDITRCQVKNEGLQGISGLSFESANDPGSPERIIGNGKITADEIVIPFSVSEGYSLWDEYENILYDENKEEDEDNCPIHHNIKVTGDANDIDFTFDDENCTLTIRPPKKENGDWLYKNIVVQTAAVGHKNMKYMYNSSMDPMPDKIEVLFNEGVDENGMSTGKDIKGVVRLTSGDGTPISELLSSGNVYDQAWWSIGVNQNDMDNFGFERIDGNYVAEHEFTIPKERVRAYEGWVGYFDEQGEYDDDIIVFVYFRLRDRGIKFCHPEFVKVYKYVVGEGCIEGQYPLPSPVSAVSMQGERADYHFCIGELPEHHSISKVELRKQVKNAGGGSVYETKSLPEPRTETVNGKTYTYYTIPAYEIDTNLIYIDISVTADDEYTPEPLTVVKTLNGSTLSFSDECSDAGSKVTFAPGTVDFTYTIESEGRWVPTVMLGEDPIIPDSLEFNKDEQKMVLTYSGTAYRYAGKTIEIVDTKKDYTLCISTNRMNRDKVTVKDENREISPKPEYDPTDPEAEVNTDAYSDEDALRYSVDPYKEYDIYTEPMEGCIVNSVSFNEKEIKGLYEGRLEKALIVPIYDERDKVFGVNTTNYFSVSYYGPSVIHLVVKGKSYEPDSTVYVDGQEEFDLIVDGKGHPAVTGVAAKQNNKNLPDFATLVPGTNKITIDPSKAASDKPVTVTVNGKDDEVDEDGNIINRKEFTRRLYFVMRRPITKVTLSGSGVAKNSSEISQDMGSEAVYDISVDGTAPLKGLGVISDNDNTEAWIDATAKKLHIRTYKNKNGNVVLAEPGDAITVSFTYDGARLDGSDYTVKSTWPAFAAPASTVISISDTAAVISMTAPKGIEKYRNAFFEVVAEPTEQQEGELFKEIVMHYVSVDSLEANALKLDFADKAVPETDHAQRAYKVSIRIVQHRKTADGEPAENSGVLASASAKIKELNVKTRALAYETKLSLGGKTTSFIRGQKNVLVAAAKFSAKTSVAELDTDRTFITDADGNVHSDIFDYPGAGNIKLKDTSALAIGTAVLTAYPRVPDGVQSSPATVKLTVKAPITGVSISPSQTRLLKVNGKAATLKLTAVLSSVPGYKPASTNVRWDMIAGSRLKRYITIKNGTVNVDKAFVPSNDPKNNRFTVIATANDYQSDDDRSDTLTVEISSVPDKVSKVEVYDGDEKIDIDLSDAGADELKGKRLVFRDEDQRLISPENITIKVSPNTMKISSDGTITSVEKEGEYKLTLTSGDGSKSKTEQIIKIKPSGDPVYDVKAYVFDGYDGDEITTWLNNDTAALPGGETVVFVSERSDSCLANASKFSVTGGKKINLSDHALSAFAASALGPEKNYIVFAVKPTSANVTVTFSPDGGRNNNTVYKIKNNIAAGKLSGKPELYANSTGKKYSFTFSTDYDDVESCNLRFAMNDSMLSSKKQQEFEAAQKIMNALNGAFAEENKPNVGYDRDKKTITVKNIELDDIPKGNYKLDATLCNGYPSVTKPVTFTFKVADAKAPKFALKGDVTMKDGDTKELEFKSMANGSLVENSVTFMNNNAGGRINGFKTYFVITQDGGKISIKQNGAPGPDDRIGWISYQVKGLDGRTVTFTDKVTVKQPK